MNDVCQGEERSDAAIHLDFDWIATPDFVGLAMTNDGYSLAGRRSSGRPWQSSSNLSIGYAEIDGVPARVLPDGDKKAQLTRTVFYTEVAPTAEAVKVASN